MHIFIFNITLDKTYSYECIKMISENKYFDHTVCNGTVVLITYKIAKLLELELTTFLKECENISFSEYA